MAGPKTVPANGTDGAIVNALAGMVGFQIPKPVGTGAPAWPQSLVQTPIF